LDLQLVDVTLKSFTNAPEGLVGENFMTKLSRCKLGKNFQGPNIGLSRLQTFVVGLVTTFLKVSTKTKRV